MSEPNPEVGATPELTSKIAKRRWREYETRIVVSGAVQPIRIGLAASFTANTLVQFVGAYLVDNGLEPAFSVGPYNQLFQVCNNPSAAFAGSCDVIVILWRLEDLILEEIE